ncbi:hypothetical protein E3N88_13242 [Mikania micrantha]|uniref:Uncharacterized protein n=1 Tax=Mikania micrantha TaxID=192012 RepID=A0A5N6P876_9ASTR|nr:hypothetical protein E3N88_13242 [Mikania micrantha]
MKLISVSQLDEQGLNVNFGSGKWKVIKGNRVIARGKKQGSLYLVEVSTDEGCYRIGGEDEKGNSAPTHLHRRAIDQLRFWVIASDWTPMNVTNLSTR